MIYKNFQGDDGEDDSDKEDDLYSSNDKKKVSLPKKKIKTVNKTDKISKLEIMNSQELDYEEYSYQSNVPF